MTCAPAWVWYVLAAGVLLVIALQLLLIVRSQTPARHAAEAAYELRETKAFLCRLFGTPVGSTDRAEIEAFARERRQSGPSNPPEAIR